MAHSDKDNLPQRKKRPGGTFAGDGKMPKFNLLEGEAAIRLLELRMNVAEAETLGGGMQVQSGYNLLSLDEGKVALATAEHEFADLVRRETIGLNESRPAKLEGAALEQWITKRQRDILAAHENTGYIALD